MGLSVIQQCIFILMLTQGFCSAEIRLDQSPAVVKRPGETVKMSCKISGYSMTSYNIHWIRQKPGKALEWIGRMNAGSNQATYAESVKNQLIFTEDVSTSTQYLEAKSLRTDDTAVYYCARDGIWRHAFDYWGKGTTVTVTSAVQGPPQSLFPVWQCGSASDGLITLGCVTRDLASADGLIFKWADEKGSALTDVVQYPAVRGSGGFTSVSQVRVKASDWTQSKKFTCRVENAKGYKEALLQKKVVPELPASLLLTTPTQTEIDNGTATFICLATQFSPKTHTFKWTRGSTELGNKVKHTILSPDKDAYTAVSILEISANEWTGSSSPVKCEFHQKKWTAAKEAIYVSVDSKPPQVKIIPPCARDMLLKRAGQLECRAEGQVGFKGIKWLIGGTEISSLAEKDVSTETTVTLTTPISFDEWSDGTKFTCEVEHSAFALQYETVDYQRVNGKKECPKVYLLAPPESSGESVTLTCYVKDFYPKEVAVSWLVNDEQVDDEGGYEQNTTRVIERGNLFSVYSQLIVKTAEWKSGAVYSCRVYHESIEDPVRLISRSITITSNPPTLVNLSLNVPQTCHTF